MPRSDGAFERALVVDDNATNRMLLELILGEAGLVVVQANDGREACEAFQGGRFSIIFMDLQMPVMGGLEAIRAIRSYEAEAGLGRTPIVINSCLSDREHRSFGAAAGADAYITKPLQVGQVLDTVKTLNDSAEQVWTASADGALQVSAG